MIEEAVVSILQNDAAVAALVADRIQPLVVTGLSLPAISFQKVSGEPDRTHQGSNGLDQSRIQVDAWSQTYEQAKDLGKAIRSALEDSRGLTSGTNILGSGLESDNDFFEPDRPTQDSEERIYRVSADYFFWHD